MPSLRSISRYPFTIPLLSILAALLLSSLIIMAAGRDPLMIFQKMLRSVAGSPYGMGQVLFRTTTLVCVGLAVALPFHLKLFNIGGEGQLLMGTFAAAMAGLFLPQTVPPMVAIALCTLAAMAAGSLWALTAALLKVRFGVNEVIGTIMLNFIAQGITGYLLTWHFAVPSTVHTAPIIDSATIPTFSVLTGWFASSPANPSIIFVLLVALMLHLLLYHSRMGYEMRAAGLQPDAARYGGINATMHTLTAFALGGAIAALGATNMVLGYKHYFESGMSGGLGFTGIAVALLAGAHPLWLLLSALFFATLEYGGLTVNIWIPKDIFMIIQALTILIFISLSALGKRAN